MCQRVIFYTYPGSVFVELVFSILNTLIPVPFCTASSKFKIWFIYFDTHQPSLTSSHIPQSLMWVCKPEETFLYLDISRKLFKKHPLLTYSRIRRPSKWPSRHHWDLPRHHGNTQWPSQEHLNHKNREMGSVLFKIIFLIWFIPGCICCSKVSPTFSHHYQGSIDFNTVNIQRTIGKYFLVFTGNWVNIGGYDL